MSFTLPTDYASRPVAVIGAGTLGRRIALMFAAHGAEVIINDLSKDQRDAAVDYVAETLPTLTGGPKDLPRAWFRPRPTSPRRSAPRGW